MSTRVYGWDQNPVADRFVYRCSNSSADNAVLYGIAFAIVDGDGRKAIQLHEPDLVTRWSREISVGMVSSGTVLAFIRTHCQGDKLHYEIPHAGDRGLVARHRRTLIRVSSRVAPQFRIQRIA